MVPLRNFGVCEQSVVAASEASLHTLSNIVVKRKVCAEGVVRVLPIAILRFVDRLMTVSNPIAKHPSSKGPLTNHSSTK